MTLDELKVYQPSSFSDLRGDLWTIWKEDEFDPGIRFNHDKVSVSKKNVLRGLHGDKKATKLVTCVLGKVFFVVVDYRKESKNFLKHQVFELSDQNKLQVLVPPMFANAHLVLSEEAVFLYKWSYDGEYPDVDMQFSLNWRDPALHINWPINDPILSERDRNSLFIASNDYA